VALGLPSGGLAAGGGAPSRGEGEVARVGGEGGALVWWKGGGGAAGRHREGSASALDRGPARAGGCEGEREVREGGEGEG
jgi:hypothetical protein